MGLRGWREEQGSRALLKTLTSVGGIELPFSFPYHSYTQVWPRRHGFWEYVLTGGNHEVV